MPDELSLPDWFLADLLPLQAIIEITITMQKSKFFIFWYFSLRRLIYLTQVAGCLFLVAG